jgi:hypothetical protein
LKLIFLFCSCSCIMLGGSIQWTIASGGNGHYYEVIAAPGGITWNAASAAATALGGYLATITSAAENNFVFNLANNPSYYMDVNGNRALGPWLGGYRTGPSSFAWVTAEPFVYTHWASNEPSNSNEDENNIEYLGKCTFSPCALAATWNDLSSGADTFYNQLPIGYAVEFNTEPVPEPGSMAFLVAGMTAVWLRRRHSQLR